MALAEDVNQGLVRVVQCRLGILRETMNVGREYCTLEIIVHKLQQNGVSS